LGVALLGVNAKIKIKIFFIFTILHNCLFRQPFWLIHQPINPIAMIPLEKFTIHSSLNPDRVRETLLTVVEPRQILPWNAKNSAKPYQGEIGDRAFQISRNINYRNSFLPTIDGRITPEGTGSQIEISMSLDPVVFIFMLVWLGMVGNMGILFLLATLSEGKFEPAALILLGMFLFGCLLPFVGFKPEAQKAKKFLIQLLET
jgi:hypothetical protein